MNAESMAESKKQRSLITKTTAGQKPYWAHGSRSVPSIA
jgi:hypothetical protein